jgi:hypothetical protein
MKRCGKHTLRHVSGMVDSETVSFDNEQNKRDNHPYEKIVKKRTYEG